MNEEEYGHHEPGYDPRGLDFDPPYTPEREARMLIRANREAEPAPVCPVCGEVHQEAHSPE